MYSNTSMCTIRYLQLLAPNTGDAGEPAHPFVPTDNTIPYNAIPDNAGTRVRSSSSSPPSSSQVRHEGPARKGQRDHARLRCTYILVAFNARSAQVGAGKGGGRGRRYPRVPSKRIVRESAATCHTPYTVHHTVIQSYSHSTVIQSYSHTVMRSCSHEDACL